VRTRLLAGAVGLLFLLSVAAMFDVNARTGPVDAVAPRPGTYRYRSVGVSTRTSPSTTTDRQDRTYTLRYEPLPSPPGETQLRRRSETASYQDKTWRADGVYNLSETYTGRNGELTCTWRPPHLVIPLPIQVGESWKSESSCDANSLPAGVRPQHETQSGKVTGRKHTVVGGRRVEVFVIETLTTTINTFGTAARPTVLANKEKSTFLFAPGSGLVVHAQRKAHVLTRTGETTDAEFWFDATDDLLSLTPA
jgi:hypothetical protein